jgi:hypothetical protein
MIMTSHYLDLVTAETVKLLQQKGADATQVTASTRFLGGDVDNRAGRGDRQAPVSCWFLLVFYRWRIGIPV